MKSYQHDAGHVTKMAAMSTLEIFSGTGGRFLQILVCSIREFISIVVCLNDDPEFTLTYFMARPNFVL